MSKEIIPLLIRSIRDPHPTKPSIPGLTPREGQIIAILAEGKVPKEVSSELGITYETVRAYLRSIYRKMGVRSQTEAVIKYLQTING